MSCRIIAEIGTSHRGDLTLAEELIHTAADSGADCAKFQIVFAEEIIHKKTGNVPLPGGSIPLYDHFRSLEQPLEFYRALKVMCSNYGIEFSASPFGLKSLKLLMELEPAFIKIASPELNHIPLLKEAASFNLPVVLSTGVSTLGDIERALDLCPKSTLLHCVTAYPAPEEQYNLSLLPLFSRIFGCPVGISDHSRDPLKVPLLSLTQGAEMIEKHICIKRGTLGLDDPFALDGKQFSLMCNEIRSLETLSKVDQLSELTKRWGESLVKVILGEGKKELAPAEKDNYGRTNRSLHALFALKAGTVLSESNCAWLRTEKILRPGISPSFYEDVMGKKIVRDVEDGEGIRWEDLLLPGDVEIPPSD